MRRRYADTSTASCKSAYRAAIVPEILPNALTQSYMVPGFANELSRTYFSSAALHDRCIGLEVRSRWA
jgi:hypothetical protein